MVAVTTASCRIANPDSLDDATLDSMAQLFSAHYGVWGPRGPKPGERVRMSAARLREQHLFDNACGTVLASSPEGELVGHLTFRVFDFFGGRAVWMSQLIVHSAWRSQKLASMMLASALATVHDLRACGMATSHPHAVRAMEKVFGARCEPAVASTLAEPFVASCGIPYIIQGAPRRVSATPPSSVIDTRFFVDHAEVDALRASMPNWHLGELNEGEEFFVLAVRLAAA